MDRDITSRIGNKIGKTPGQIELEVATEFVNSLEVLIYEIVGDHNFGNIKTTAEVIEAKNNLVQFLIKKGIKMSTFEQNEAIKEFAEKFFDAIKNTNELFELPAYKEIIKKDGQGFCDYVDYIKELLVLIQNDANYYYAMFSIVVAYIRNNDREKFRMITLILKDTHIL